MPRTRGTEMAPAPPQTQPQPQRQSPRAPLHMRTTNSDSNGVPTHHRSSPKLEDVHRRSPRSPLLPERKRGSKVTDLETKLGHVQEELKKLREQLASAEAAKRDAQHELLEARKKLPTTPPAAGEQVEEAEEESCVSAEVHQPGVGGRGEEPSAEASPPPEEEGTEVNSVAVTSTDAAAAPDSVPEKERDGGDDDVTVEEEAVKEKSEGGEVVNEGEGEEAAAAVVPEGEEAQAEESQAAAMAELEAKLEEKLEELERCLSENASLKEQLAEAETSAAAARTREEEAALKLASAAEELAGSKARADQLGEQLAAAEGAAAALEAEMKKLKIQTEQWRKAADAAVAALSVTGGFGSEGGGGRRGAERCGSMDKHHLHAGEFSGMDSPPPMGDDSDDAWAGGAKRKGPGIRMFGDLWKKKSQHQHQHHQQ